MRVEAQLTSKGQLTIPKLFRDALGVDAKKAVEMDLQGDSIVIRRKGSARARQRRMMEALKSLGLTGDVDLSTEEIMRLSRGDDWNSPTPSG